jgi:hypothetical protein
MQLLVSIGRKLSSIDFQYVTRHCFIRYSATA